MKKIPVWAVVLGVLVVLGLWTMGAYNGLVSADAGVDNAWAQVQVQYQRRADLVPQLVATVQGAADFESTTLEDVTKARTNWLNVAQDSQATRADMITSSQTFDSAFSRLLVSVESYPTLTATAGFQTLQTQLEGNENRISVARKDYNDAATFFNVKIKTVPTVIIAKLFGFDEATLFEANEEAATAPSIEFNSNSNE